MGDWSTDGTDPSSAGTMSSLSARLTDHAEWWQDQIAESELLEGTREEASDRTRSDAVLAMFDVAPLGRVAVVALVLNGLIAHLVGLAARLSPVGDALARRVVRLVLADLEDRPQPR